MYTVRVLSEIDDRLDAEYYNPEALVTINKMETKGSITTFGDLVSEGYRVVYHGTDSTNGLKDNETLPFLSPTQIDKNGAISFENTDRLPIYYKDKYPKGLGSVGEILVEVKGNVSKVGIIPSHFPKNLMISGSLYKATLDATRADSHYILAFLKSKHGQTLKNRLTSNTIINYIAKDALYSIPIIELDVITQKYIGDKVRQAEQLRAWAKILERKADSSINMLFKFENIESLTTKPRRLDSQLLSSISLSPEFSRATECQRTFVDSSKLSLFLDQCKCGDPIKSEDRISGSFFYYGASGPIDTHSEYNFDGEYLIIAQDGSIGCVNIVRGKFWANNHVWVLKIKSGYDIDSIGRFLSKNFPCWKGITTGSVIPKVTSENLLNISIPNEIAKNINIGDTLRAASTATSYSKLLTALAKNLVEALIEGQLTEEQLIQAQQALEDGDNTLDSAILSKLSSEGYAVEGTAPLFSDIDELYHLLASATATDSED
ncbi:restriction endonuclease subunit S [Psychrobacter faecalis]